ncbi:hypothetical protein [Pseudomonas sp. NFR16]|uniref:hypothetical protein n=1 Tax=Pseudomonas sp. NFR16 TaxID=1566248 RepID=UPI0008B75087|nr:hypothetical protein [Pseudomonas sp. NFR16]SEJ70288.1 CDP-diacylglycerol--glycerol-3-phosphate 3-phosphatidyltransferase [Pseudomonas sp. NFR16]
MTTATLQKWLHPLARMLFDDGVRAVHVTLCAGLISVAVGALVAAFAFHLWIFALIPIWIVIRMIFGVIETQLVSEFGQSSRAATCARELSRVVAETALALPFSVVPKISLLLVLLVAWLSILSEFAGLLGPLVKASRRREGPLPGSIRLLIFAVFGTTLALGYLPTAAINIVLAVMAVLLVITIGRRIRHALHEVTPPAPTS